MFSSASGVIALLTGAAALGLRGVQVVFLLRVRRTSPGTAPTKRGDWARSSRARARDVLTQCCAGVFTLAAVLYAARPEWIAWAGVALPPAWRTIGFLPVALGMGLYVTAGRALGDDFGVGVVPVEGGRLVAAGPYRVLRHPMYLGEVLVCAGLAWAVGSLLLGGLTVAVGAGLALRAGEEERLLQRRFGETYARYCRLTGRFLPRCSRF